MPSLRLMPLPSQFWRKQPFLTEASWSQTLSRFRTMNTGLGNRNSYYKNYAVFIEEGRVVTCPLCLSGNNDEIHILRQCNVLKEEREKIIIINNISLEQELKNIEATYKAENNEEVIRIFLGQEKNVIKHRMALRGVALECLLDNFFIKSV